MMCFFTVLTCSLKHFSFLGENYDQVLGVARLKNGTASAGATEVVERLNRWRIVLVPRYIAFDTTNVMSGRRN